MPIRVLLVDDSTVVRGLMNTALTADAQIEVVGAAANGEMAINLAKNLQPDIIILDIEMPVMDGITALPQLRAVSEKSKIIMASTLTLRNAEISMRAMALGASDYVPKPSAKNANEVESFYRELITKTKALGGAKTAPSAAPTNVNTQSTVVPLAKPQETTAAPALVAPNTASIKALAIASSTGGPQALITLFDQLRGRLKNVPIFITQHMPPNFTAILADHLSKAGNRQCFEAKAGQSVVAGCVYVAPGDYHMVAEQSPEGVVVQINQNPQENYCRPAADPMLRSLSEIYGKHLMTLVLTGMGQDGLEGAKVVVGRGGSVIAQDESTSVVYGMPKAVVENKLCQAVLPLPAIAPYLIKQIEGMA